MKKKSGKSEAEYRTEQNLQYMQGILDKSLSTFDSVELHNKKNYRVILTVELPVFGVVMAKEYSMSEDDVNTAIEQNKVFHDITERSTYFKPVSHEKSLIGRPTVWFYLGRDPVAFKD